MLNSCRSFLVRRHHIKKERQQAFFFRIRLPLVAVVGHHHAAVGLGADGVGIHTGDILQGGVDHMALIGVHGLQGDAAAILGDLSGHLAGQGLQALLALGPVVLGVHMDADALFPAGIDGIVGQLLDGIQGLAPAADELAQLLALQHHAVTALLRLGDCTWAGLSICSSRPVRNSVMRRALSSWQSS